MNNEINKTEKTSGYYSGNTNIIQTLVDCIYDTVLLTGKSLVPFFKWLMDGWIDFDNTEENKIDVKRDCVEFFENSNLSIKGVAPVYSGEGETETYKYYMFQVPLGMCVGDFFNKIDRLAILLDCFEDEIRITQKGCLIQVQILKPRETSIYDPDIYKRTDFKIPLGHDRDNNLVLLDLLISRNFGCYVAGSSGGGKSYTVRLILTHLINNMSYKDLELVIINTKCVDLSYFKICKHTILYQKGTDDIVKNLEVQIKEMNDRYDLFDKKGFDDIWEARENHYRMPFRLIVIEEISAYVDDKEFHKLLKRLAEMGRAAGIFLICACQFPNKDVLPSVTKCNFNTVLGHKTINELTSEVIAGKDSGLEKLKGDGHNKVFCVDYQGVEYQSLYVSKSTMKEIINKNKK